MSKVVAISEMKEIYDRLSDDESRDIFNMRLSYAMGDVDTFDFLELLSGKGCQLGLKFSKWLCERTELDKLIVFGAGRIGKYTLDLLRICDINIEACVDSNIKSSYVYNGVSVIPFKELDGIKNSCKIIIASGSFRYQMLEQLLRNGIDMSQIWFPAWEYIRGKSGNQYFDYFEPNAYESFVDGGAYNGMTTVDFFKWLSSGNGKSYLFEANPNNEKMISRCMHDNNIQNYRLIGKGLYDANQLVKFSTHDGAGAMISKEGDDIEVTSLDYTLFNNEDMITFLKMDIEGAELKAIEGGRNIIKRDSPRCALSVYHKRNDFWEIPQKLLTIHSDYSFAFRHYSTNAEETVLYAWRA